jgi:hypothetical protein
MAGPSGKPGGRTAPKGKIGTAIQGTPNGKTKTLGGKKMPVSRSAMRRTA